MITCEETKDFKIIESILKHPVLFSIINGIDADINKFKVDPLWSYLLLKKDKEVIGCFRFRLFTRITIEAHVAILPEHHGSVTVDEVSRVAIQWAKEQGYKKIFCPVPVNCPHVIKFITRLGYKACGMIDKGIIHNGHLVSLLFFDLEV